MGLFNRKPTDLKFEEFVTSVIDRNHGIPGSATVFESLREYN